MSVLRIHVDELDADATLVRRLLTAQFPECAELPIEALPVGGTDDAIFRRTNAASVPLLTGRALLATCQRCSQRCGASTLLEALDREAAAAHFARGMRQHAPASPHSPGRSTSTL